MKALKCDQRNLYTDDFSNLKFSKSNSFSLLIFLWEMYSQGHGPFKAEHSICVRLSCLGRCGREGERCCSL